MVTLSIAGVFVAGVATLLALTDVRLALALAVWSAPVIVLGSLAYSAAAKRAHDPRAVTLALVLPAIAGVWVVWLVLARGVIGHHP